MANVGIGRSVIRIEDDALLRGAGQFIDDINLPGQTHAHFLRSPHAHAVIARIDASAAEAAPGVVAVLTGADLAADGIGLISSGYPVKNKDGSPIQAPVWRAMATERVRYVGDTVAVVLAETRIQAEDAATLIDIDYEELPCVTDPIQASQNDGAVIWEDFGSNVALDWETGDKAAVDAAFSRAAHVTRLDVVNNRIMVNSLEPRGAVARYDALDDRYTLYTTTQGSNEIRSSLAKSGLQVPLEKIRVITPPDVGGGFGIKNGLYPEQIVTSWAAKRIGRAVKWYPERTDGFLTDYHARDHRMHGELALDADGKFLALRCQTISNMGAYLTGGAPIIPTAGGTRMLTNVYRIDAIHAETQCVFTNTVPIAAFRGAGKPEFCHVVERLVDAAAREMAIDPAELRRRNMVAPTDFPYTTATGLVYDSGEFAGNMDQALNLAGRDSVELRRADAAARGKLLGFGFSTYTEPDGFKDNRVSMQFDPTGQLSVTLTGHTNGQGHKTVFSQIVSEKLGLPFENINVIQGDTDRIGPGSGSGGSRTTTVAGGAIHHGALEIIAKGKRIAAHMLEASAEDISFDAGQFVITGTDRSIDLVSVATASFSDANLPDDLGLGLEAAHHYVARTYSFPCGCHVCEVEIDQNTGMVDITRYQMVSDFGVVINPMLVEGQLHGGVVQGIGQALNEESLYDPVSGQLVTGSGMDYWMPRAREIPNFDWAVNETRCETNPLGVKGCGESGPTAALPAVINAVVDALAPFGVTHIDMPATPERIWRAINGKAA
ncbi:MAG: xanthine dehydrogenase family protein molybdopterin-binding subunit [Rhodospirillaceae bacterium]|nr:xanthine dehydrogenase family protein molybdopterin-binding subunit [Rhodospirillaceae bacterium]MBT5811392.1 xanthine dehydrogenase family protein molybdopterin-binding subunit [Rhodospirillaceae bacterium]